MRRLALFLALAGCSGSSGGGRAVPPKVLDLTGRWDFQIDGEWAGVPLNFSAQLVHGQIRGTLDFKDTEYGRISTLHQCFPQTGGGYVAGSLLDVTLNLFSQPGSHDHVGDAWLVGLAVIVDRIEGTFTVPTGRCAGDQGYWSATRS